MWNYMLAGIAALFHQIHRYNTKIIPLATLRNFIISSLILFTYRLSYEDYIYTLNNIVQC